MDTDHARELLARERERIERALEDARRREDDEDADPYEASDAGSDLYEAELGEGLAERLAEELEAVERAEKRLEEGTYGLSVESGKPIPDGRLEIIPWAERTAEEQARYERLGR
jgi:DnaK suppressor protein